LERFSLMARACARNDGAPFRRSPLFRRGKRRCFDFSTAHVAHDSGVRAEEQAISSQRVALIIGRGRSVASVQLPGRRMSTLCLQAACARAVENRRCGFPPDGFRGPPSSSQMASRMASMLTDIFRPSGRCSAGQEAIAEASEAQEARIARFSASDRDGCITTSLGWSKTVPGQRST
jgi:hypothetical protein